MYFSRLRLRPDIQAAALARQLCNYSGYQEHQLLWKLFDIDPDASRDFLFRRDDCHGWPSFYLLSRRLPEDQAQIWHIEHREYRPRLQKGQRLAFILRANPVITRKSVDGKSRRHDLVMDLKKRNNWKETEKSERSNLSDLTQQAGEIWLGERLGRNGAKLESVRSEAYVQHQAHKKGQQKSIRYSSLDLQGTLLVTEPESLVEILFHGIGPAKAFGCGLMLVRKI